MAYGTAEAGALSERIQTGPPSAFVLALATRHFDHG